MTIVHRIKQQPACWPRSARPRRARSAMSKRARPGRKTASETIETPKDQEKAQNTRLLPGRISDRATLGEFDRNYLNPREQGLPGSCAGFRLAGQREQPVAIDVLLEVVGQQVERGIDVGFVVEAGRRPPTRCQPVLPLAVVGQKTVDVAAGDAAIGLTAPSVWPLPSLAAAGPRRRAADMHFVALERHAAVGGLAAAPRPAPCRLRARVDVEQAEAHRPSPAGPRCRRGSAMLRPSI